MYLSSIDQVNTYFHLLHCAIFVGSLSPVINTRVFNIYTHGNEVSILILMRFHSVATFLQLAMDTELFVSPDMQMYVVWGIATSTSRTVTNGVLSSSGRSTKRSRESISIITLLKGPGATNVCLQSVP